MHRRSRRQQAVEGSAGATAGASQGGVFAQIPDIVDRGEPSVVAILTEEGRGSGVAWDGDGWVGDQPSRGDRLQPGRGGVRRRPASGRRDRRQGPPDRPRRRAGRPFGAAASFTDALPRVGELAIAIGNPLGARERVTAGIISGLERAIPGAVQAAPALIDLVHADAAISPGNSGGALVNTQGRVVGINVAYILPTVGSLNVPTLRRWPETLRA